jgi:hypothetical protein
MGRFTVIPTAAFDGLQVDAGVLLRRFNPANPVAPADEDIICATTGGVNPSCVPTFSDYGEDVDNVPNNMMEFKHLDGWEVTLGTTSLGTTPELIKLALGCADIDGENTSKIIPRRDLKQTDFSDIWWVGDKADGGFVAIQIKNALSTGGFSLQTTKNGKGQIALTITGHVSINAQSVVPMVIYSYEGDDTGFFSVQQILSHVASNFVDASVESGDSIEVTLTADTGYEIGTVVVTMGGTDVTSTAYDDTTDKVTIASVSGDIVILATGELAG